MKNSKMFLRISFIICISLAVAFYFAGCGGDKDDDDKYLPLLTPTGTGTGTGTGPGTGTGTGTGTALITADFTASPVFGAAPLTVNFTDLSQGTVTGWSWDFGDAGTSTEQNPSHIYNSDGTYEVTLTVTGPDGSDTETKADCIFVGTASVYYVDAASGDDGNPGTEAEPWLTIDRGVSSLQPGDTVLVREGIYRESVTIGVSGVSGGRIIIKAYPGENPILEGTVQLAGWTQCTFNEPGLTVLGVTNPNYANIYKAEVDEADVSNIGDLLILENGEMLQIAQWPDQASPVCDDVHLYIPLTDSRNWGQRNYLYDPPNLNQADGYWTGAWVKVRSHGANNVFLRKRITDFAGGTITFDSALIADLVDSPDEYSITNHPHILDKPGEFCHTTTPVGGKYTIYLWPKDTGNLADRMAISKLKLGFFLLGESYITIDGFEIRGFSGDDTRSGGIINPANFPQHSDVIIRNNKVHNIRGYVGIGISDVNNDLVEGNTVYNLGGARGLMLTRGPNMMTRNNIIYATEGTSIDYYGITNGQIIGNIIGGSGLHGNGITTYLNNRDILIANNIVLDAGYAVTMSGSENLTYINNILHATAYYTIASWGGMSGTVRLLNNVIIGRPDASYSVNLGSSINAIIKNNILAGGGIYGDRSHNVVIALSWMESVADFNPGGSHELDILCDGDSGRPDRYDIFVDPDNHDYRLRAGCPAIDAGVDITADFPTADFPDFDLGVDIVGNPRDASPDIGPYEYTP